MERLQQQPAEQSPRTPTGATKGFLHRWETVIATTSLSFGVLSMATAASDSFAQGDIKKGYFYGAAAVIGVIGNIASAVKADIEKQSRDQTIQSQQQTIQDLQNKQ